MKTIFLRRLFFWHVNRNLYNRSNELITSFVQFDAIETERSSAEDDIIKLTFLSLSLAPLIVD